MTTIKVARSFLYLMVAVQLCVAAAAFVHPDIVTRAFGFTAETTTGKAELRVFYGSGVFAWGLLTLGALRWRRMSPGLLLAMGTIMALLAIGRLVSLILDGAVDLNLSAGAAEAITAVACWTIFKAQQQED